MAQMGIFHVALRLFVATLASVRAHLELRPIHCSGLSNDSIALAPSGINIHRPSERVSAGRTQQGLMGSMTDTEVSWPD